MSRRADFSPARGAHCEPGGGSLENQRGLTVNPKHSNEHLSEQQKREHRAKGAGGNSGGDNVIDLITARAFVKFLHRGLDPDKDGEVAFLVRRRVGGPVRTLSAHPGELPAYLTTAAAEVFVSVCTFRGHRAAANARTVPAVWADIDPPPGGDLEHWRKETSRRIVGFVSLPSAIVSSGRGWHLYWFLDPAVCLDGPDRDRLAGLVVGVNRKLADLLDGDTVGDLARVMRLPGTVNPKNGARCRQVFEAGPMYELQHLAEDLGVTPGSVVPSAPPPRWSPVPSVKAARRRGRPRLEVKKRDLRTLPPWARSLVVGGAWRAGKRYMTAGRVDRSRADLAACGAMLRAEWSEEMIVGAFTRGDWLIGARFQELWECEGQGRARGYLCRTIARARQERRFTPKKSSRLTRWPDFGGGPDAA